MSGKGPGDLEELFHQQNRDAQLPSNAGRFHDLGDVCDTLSAPLVGGQGTQGPSSQLDTAGHHGMETNQIQNLIHAFLCFRQERRSGLSIRCYHGPF